MGQTLSFKSPILRYAVSTFGKSLPWIAADNFALYFLTETAHLPPARAGAFILAAYILGAASDPVVGALFEAKPRDPAKRWRYFLFYQVLAAALFSLMFIRLPLGAAAPWVLLASALGFRAAFSRMDVPHNAMLGVLARQHGAALNLGAVRLTASIMASFAITFAADPVLHATPAQAPLAFGLYAAGVAITGAILFLGFLPPAPSTPPLPLAPAERLGSALQPAVLLFFASTAAEGLVAGFIPKALPYLGKYVFGDPAWAVAALGLVTAAKLAAAPGWLLAQRFWGMSGAWRAALSLLVIIGALFATAPLHSAVALTLTFGLGLGLGGVNMLGWAQAAAIAAQSDKPADARLFGGFSAVNKIASGAAGWLLGLLLALSLGPEAKEVIYRAFGLVCAVGFALGWLCLEAYWRSARQPRPGSDGHGGVGQPGQAILGAADIAVDEARP